MAVRNPTLEILIRDEVTAGMERARQRLRSEDSRTTFTKTQAGIKSLEGSFQQLGSLVRREFGSLLQLTGVGGFLGGGLVAGLYQASQALSNLARSSLQNRYTAEALGITSDAFNRLVARGMAVGQSQQQAETSIKNFTEGLRNMQTQGKESREWKELLGGKGGARLGRELLAALQSGGIEAAARYLAQRMEDMPLSGQRSLAKTFGLGLGFKDIFKFSQSEIGEIYQLSEPEARKFALSMAQLNISYQNIKLSIAQAIMPAFARMAEGLDKLLRGPLGDTVKEFGTWLKTLNIPWDKIAAGIVRILKAFGDFFTSMGAFFKDMDPIVKEMGGWKVVIGGLAIILGTAGLAGWLSGVTLGLTALGNAAWVLPLLGAIVAISAAETAYIGPAEGAGKGKRLDRPDRPPPMGRRPSTPTGPQPAPSGPAPPAMQRRTSLNDPENAPPYRVAGGWQPPPSRREEASAHDTSELREQVKAVKTEVVRLTGYISGLGLTTDDTGAGGLAGFRGVLGRLSAPMGGAPGGGGGDGRGRAPRGGGGGGGGGDGDGRGRAPRGRGGGGGENVPLPGGSGSAAIYQKLLAAYRNSGLVGTVPVDGARYGFKTGSAEEWARFGMIIAASESDYRPGTVGPRGEKSYGIFQYDHPQVPGGSAWDVDASVNAFVRDSKDSMRTHGGFTRGSMLHRRFSTIKNTPPPSRHQQADEAIRKAQAQPQQRTATPDTTTQTTRTDNTPASLPDKVALPPTSGGIWPSPVTGTTGGQVGDRRPAYDGRRAGPHMGVDITAKHWEPVASQFGGTIRTWISGGPAGNAVEIRYDNGYTVRFFHLAGFGKIRSGRVEAGDVVGYVGGTGPGGRERYSKHLHYEVRDQYGRLVNPNSVLGIDPRNPRGVRLTGGQPGQGQLPDMAEREKQLDQFRQQERERWRHLEPDAPSLLGLSRQRQGRIGLQIRVRGPRGVKTTADSSGVVSPPTISREMDPTGGGRIESPA